MATRDPARIDIAVLQGTHWMEPLRLLSGGVLIDTSAYTARAQIRADVDAAVALDMTTANGLIAVGFDPPKFAISTAYALGQQVVPITLNGYVYEVTVAGTSGGSSPTWPTVIGTTVVSGGVTFRAESTDAVVTNLRISIPPATSSPLTDWGLGRWDLELIDPFGNVQRIAEGEAVLSREVTR